MRIDIEKIILSSIAEQYYREYRYNKTLEIIRNALDKVEPGAYERIRNSVKAN